MEIFVLAFVFVVSILVLINPKYFFYFVIFDAFNVYRFYSKIGDLPVLFLVGFIFLISSLQNLDFKFHKNRIYFIFFLLSFYMFLSYFNRFNNFDYTFFNNFIILSLFLAYYKQLSFKLLREITKIVLIVSIFISLQIIVIIAFDLVKEVGGGLRQLPLHIVLSLPFIFVFYNLSNSFTKFQLRSLLILMLVVILMTGGRTSLGLFLLMTVYYLFNFESRKLFYSLGIFFTIGSVLVLPIIIKEIIYTYFFRDMSIQGDLISIITNPAFNSGRSLFVLDALEMFYDHPFFGYGINGFKSFGNPYNRFATRYGLEGLSVHNVHVQYLAEIGIIGYSLYLFILLSSVLIGYKFMKRYFHLKKSIEYQTGQIIFLLFSLFFIDNFSDNQGFQNRVFLLGVFFTILLLNHKKRVIECAE